MKTFAAVLLVRIEVLLESDVAFKMFEEHRTGGIISNNNSM